MGVVDGGGRTRATARRARRAVPAVVVPLALALVAAQGPSTADQAERRGTPGDPSPLPTALVRAAAEPIRGRADDYDGLLALVGDAEVVLLGESTHGTHEFYRERARITRRLVEERGFAAVAVEADWADALPVHRWLAGGRDGGAGTALRTFRRFPRWMWANAEVRDLLERLRQGAGAGGRAAPGFYGLDLQAPQGSIAEVLRYLRPRDPVAAARARRRYACLARLGEQPERYAWSPPERISPCRRDVEAQWRELQAPRPSAAGRAAAGAEEEARFVAVQAARVVHGAEHYYGGSPDPELSPWDVRDRHMADTVDALADHLRRQGRPPKVVVWAHNTHVGDARATDLGAGGDVSLGQLLRERRGGDAVLVGFSTYAGAVVAARAWGERGVPQELPAAQAGSYPAAFHDVGLGAFLLRVPPRGALADALDEPRPERAVGVVYAPDRERVQNYLTARLAREYDAVVHVDRTRAVTPLAR